MSGDGVINVRLPKSLLETFCIVTDRQGLTRHEASRRMIVMLPDLAVNELKQLKDPPHEPYTARVSLYIGWRAVDILTAATHDSTLTNSTIFRRLLYGLLVTKELQFVQQNGDWRLQIARSKKA
jgi:hypothetical protein